MKRIAAGLLTMVMLLSMMMPVFAEEEKGSITITNTVAGQTYSLYKMFDLESYDTNNKTFSYKVSSKGWENFFVNGEGKNYVQLREGGYIADTSFENKDVQAFSKAALEWAKDEKNEIQADFTSKAEADTLTFSELPLGYYLVDSTLGTMCALNTNIPDMEFADKNQEATLTYEVKTGVDNNSNDIFGDVHDDDMNSTLTYKIEVHAKAGAENYKVYVNKPEGIVANLGEESVKVYIQSELNSNDQQQTSSVKLVNRQDYYIFTPGATYSTEVQDSAYSFGIEFAQEALDKIQEDALITITYDALLTTGASHSTIDKAIPNTSSAWMSYGDYSSTEMKDTDVYTYHLPIFKYTGDLKNPTALSGAEFRLYRESNDVNAKYASFENGKFVGWTTEGNATILKSGENGMIDVYGLGTGTYYLEETAAPTGYNKLIKPITVQISAGKEQKALYTQDETETDQINVLNNTGSKLPSTGGMGTKIFYALGATMFVSAVILLVVRKRMSK